MKNSKKPSVSKILALKEAKRPQDIKGVRSYLGMINKLSNPIRKLTHQDIKLMKRKTVGLSSSSLQTDENDNAHVISYSSRSLTL